MFFRIPRLTPGYIRYLQTQAAQTVLQSREGLVMPRVAALLGLMGVGMSGYSSRQLTLHYKPATHLIFFSTCDVMRISPIQLAFAEQPVRSSRNTSEASSTQRISLPDLTLILELTE
uniref:Uncharacterized protein n=1 Tax=Salarias fasciatus TaxID=181472 RepID=A0A672HPI8_SALFA